MARSADLLIATSTEQAEVLRRLGAARSAVRVVPHGVDTEGFCPDGPLAPRGRSPRLVHTGQLGEHDGADEVVAALASVPGAELVLAGGFGPRDQARLQALAGRCGVTQRMRLVGELPRDRVPALLRSADVVVCVPWGGQFGLAALEAMACARPVVASAVGGLADTVVHGVTGAHVPPRRPRELAAVLRGVLSSAVMTTAYGAAGRDRAVVRYNWDRIAATTEQLYRQVVERPEDGRPEDG